ncbi:MAG: exo-alpha-sialidase [Gemmatimonadota bacterium]|nr:exo-alpha-sialidase [Gemmatimonadota bacterium]
MTGRTLQPTYDMDRSWLSASLILSTLACVGGGDPSLYVAQTVVESPAGPDSGEPFLATDGERVYLSWLEAADDDHHELKMARLESDGWGAPTMIARSDRFFVNWADFPSLTPGPDGTLWAHWLQRGAAGGYDYAVRIAHSRDGGKAWSDPVTLHEDDSPTEHGFVSTFVQDDGVGFVWLDGRRYAAGPDGEPASQEMTLRYRFVGVDGSMRAETLLDGRVCDCCQTSSAVTSEGPVAVYRDRSPHEIRDIYITRLRDGAWTEGSPVHEDGWEIGGCPVNGPAVAARGTEVAVAWFTGAGNVARVKVAFSQDAGATFGEPIVVDDGNPEGRVDLLLGEDGSAYVSWLERTGGEAAEVRLRSVRPDGGASASAPLVRSSAGRPSGFPRMVARGEGDVILAWTDLEGAAPQVRVARLELENE